MVEEKKLSTRKMFSLDLRRLLASVTLVRGNYIELIPEKNSSDFCRVLFDDFELIKFNGNIKVLKRLCLCF